MINNNNNNCLWKDCKNDVRYGIKSIYLADLNKKKRKKKMKKKNVLFCFYDGSFYISMLELEKHFLLAILE